MTSSSTRRCPAPASTRRRSGRLFRHRPRSGAEEPGAARKTRRACRTQIDGWYRDNGAPSDLAAYKTFLKEIGYLLPEGPAFQVSTDNVDPEIAIVAGPQLVVPVMNARYALNAANARWGSLYDALYGTDAIPETDGAEKGKGYNPRARRQGRRLGQELPRRGGAARRAGWAAVDGLTVDGAALALTAGGSPTLRRPDAFAGYRGDAGHARGRAARATTACISRSSSIAPTRSASTDPAGIADIILESALTTIQDCEDSVAAVDAEDKVVVYRNWLGLMKGDLAEEITKGGKTLYPPPQPRPQLHGAGRRHA